MNYTQTKDLCVSLKRLFFLITLEKSSGSFMEAMWFPNHLFIIADVVEIPLRDSTPEEINDFLNAF